MEELPPEVVSRDLVSAAKLDLNSIADCEWVTRHAGVLIELSSKLLASVGTKGGREKALEYTVARYIANGYSPLHTAKELGCNQTTVFRRVKIWEERHGKLERT
jgi:hypothetical protein